MKALEQIADKLFKNVDFGDQDIEDIKAIKQEGARALYKQIILAAIENVPVDKKDDFIVKLQNIQESPEQIIGAVTEFIDEPEELITNTIREFKTELEEAFGVE